MKTVVSMNNILIRLTDERWTHIIKHHRLLDERKDDVLNTIREPDIIVLGKQGELLAANKYGNYWLIAIYKEINVYDGFIITAFMTTRLYYLLKNEVIWKKN